jgi:hypothetical protein
MAITIKIIDDFKYERPAGTSPGGTAACKLNITGRKVVLHDHNVSHQRSLLMIIASGLHTDLERIFDHNNHNIYSRRSRRHDGKPIRSLTMPEVVHDGRYFPALFLQRNLMYSVRRNTEVI